MLRLKSPAKLNLFLRVLGRRSDGYHELASLFQAVDLCDHLRVVKADQDRFTCSDADLPTDSSNLVVKARELFRREVGCQQSFSIHLDKYIPTEAGLGGGSSNAATTLWALNELMGRPVSVEMLASWAGRLGADVAFFLSQGTAYCTGYGHVVTPVAALSKQSVWIANPKAGVSTPEVYRHVHVESLPQRDARRCLDQFQRGEPVLFNDLEPAAMVVLPELAAIKQQLQGLGFDQVMLAGSGSSFICFGDGELPFIPGLELYPASFIQRTANSWY